MEGIDEFDLLTLRLQPAPQNPDPFELVGRVSGEDGVDRFLHGRGHGLPQVTGSAPGDLGRFS